MLADATASIPRAFFLIAVASFNVSVGFEPIPMLTPPDLADAERTVKRLLPIDSMFERTFSLAPFPTASIMITALTPIIIPKLVSAERILLTLSEFIDILSVDLKSIIFSPHQK